MTNSLSCTSHHRYVAYIHNKGRGVNVFTLPYVTSLLFQERTLPKRRLACLRVGMLVKY